MSTEIFDAEGYKKAIDSLKELKAKRVFLQYPEGLKTRVQDMAKAFEAEGFEVVISTEPCYGACDLRDEEALRLGCDALLHIGHEDFGLESRLPVVYWLYYIDADPIPVLEKGFEKLEKFESIGVVASLQFTHLLDVVKGYLESKGKTAVIHKSLKHPGQILGCDLKAATEIEDEVDAFLYVGAGKFYGLGIVMKTEKPVLSLDLEKGEITGLDETKRRIVKTIAWNKSQFDDAKAVGILTTWKRGQVKLPFELKSKLEKMGKEVYVFAMDEITPEKLLGLKIDVAVNLACPRIGMDDLARYKVPLLNVEDL